MSSPTATAGLERVRRVVAAAPLKRATAGPAHERDHRSRAWSTWGLAGVATHAPFVVTPGLNAERTSVFLCVFLTVAVLSPAADDERRALDRLPQAAAPMVIAMLMLFVLASVMVTARSQTLLADALHQRGQSIVAQKARGVEDAVVPSISIDIPRGYPNRAMAFSDLTTEAAHPITAAQADWFGVCTIVVRGEDTLIT